MLVCSSSTDESRISTLEDRDSRSALASICCFKNCSWPVFCEVIWPSMTRRLVLLK
ncbi:hypothetical protein D3C87_1925970 [compost metagenome]